MYSIAYVSKPADPVSVAVLDTILKVARERNRAAGITGILIYGDDTFVQILEGDQQKVEAVYNRILRDQRHFRVRTVAAAPVEERQFGDWSMAFIRDEELSPEDLADLVQLRGEALRLTKGRPGDTDTLGAQMRDLAERLERRVKEG